MRLMNFRSWQTMCVACLLTVMMATCTQVKGQVAGEEQVKLDFAEELNLAALVEFVADRLKIKFIYDEALLQKKVNIIAPEPIPKSTLMDLLQSVLRTEGLVLAVQVFQTGNRSLPKRRFRNSPCQWMPSPIWLAWVSRSQ